MEIIHTWHDFRFVGRVGPGAEKLQKEAWAIYLEKSPEMEPICAVLAKIEKLK